MPSTASSTYQDYIEGKLLTAISTSVTTGVTVKIKQVNGATPTWPTTAHRIKIVQKTATNNKVEKVGVASGTSQSGQTVTLGTLTRALPLSNGTDFTGSGTAVSFAAGADVFISWDSHDAAQSAKLDLANTFTTHQTISSTNELRFSDSATAVWDDGTSLSFKDSTTATKTLAQLAALSGSDEKVKITATDTTSSYLDDAISVTSPVTKATNNGGANETLTFALDTVPVTKGGTGLTTGTTAYAPVFTGTTATGAFQAGTAGTADQVLTSNGAAALPTFQDRKKTVECVYSSGTSSSANANPTTFVAFNTHTYGIPANDLVAGVCYEFEAGFTGTIGAGNIQFGINLGSTTIVSSLHTGGSQWSIRGFIAGTTSAGASAAVKGTMQSGSSAVKADDSTGVTSSQNVATNGSLTLQLSAKFGTSNGSNTVTCTMAKFTKVYSTAF